MSAQAETKSLYKDVIRKNIKDKKILEGVKKNLPFRHIIFPTGEICS